MTAGPEVIYCARHPDVETGLRCGRCDTPICPRCLVYTPGGTRCPDCARLRRPPMYELAGTDYARALGAAALAAAVLGAAGAFLFPPRAFTSFFLLIIAFFAGSGAGIVVAEAIHRATNGKRGIAMQVIALAAIVGAALLRHVIDGFDAQLLLRDTTGIALVLVGAVTAWGRLR